MTRLAHAAVLVVLVLCGSQAQAQERTEAPSLERARALYDAGKPAEARRDLQALVAAGTQDPQVFLLLGVIDRTAGRLGSAIASLQRAQVLTPDALPPSVELATTLAWNRDLNSAIALFRQVLTRAPDDIGARTGLAFALMWHGQLDEAEAMFDALLKSEPSNVSGWLGLGSVSRARFRRAAAAEAYRRALAIDPANADAASALEAVRWDRRGETRILPGFSSAPGTPSQVEARVDTTYLATQRLTLFGGYQRYAFGAVSPVTGGGQSVNLRQEDSLEGGIVYRPSDRTAIGANLYTFFSDDLKRGLVWVEGSFAVTSRVSLIGNVRPAFSDGDPAWLWAGAAGVTVALPRQHSVTVRLLMAADTEYEPRVTTLVNYDAVVLRRLRVRVGAAYSGTDERFEFTSLSGGATYLFTPAVGITAEGGGRTGTAPRSTLLVGVIVRR